MKRLVTGRGRRLVVGTAAALVATGALAFFTVLPPAVDAALNRARLPGAPVGERALRLHDRLLVIDLHADSLVWGRDLLERHGRGAVDLPRLVEGNVGLQVFSVVTNFTSGPAFERRAGGVDLIRLLAIAERWPSSTWSSPFERAIHQARLLDEASARSGGRLVVVRSRDDLARLVERRRSGRVPVGALLALEGLYPLEGRLENLDRLHAAGFRMMGLTHFLDNEVAGSAHGSGHGGLTDLGRGVVKRMEQLGIVVDLAHASPRTFDDVLDVATRPVVVSHTGVQATCPGRRNLTDDELRRVAANGGVVGIGYFEWTVCGSEPDDIARAVRHAADVAGVDHVGLGSDWDGAVRTIVDAAGVAAVTDALLRAGFTEEEVARIDGGNALRVLGEVLGAGS